MQASVSGLAEQLEDIDVSVVMPAFNEARSIETAIRRTLLALQSTADSYEIVVADDGSTDETCSIVKAVALQDRRVRLVSNGRNMGKGVAVKRAAKFVRGKSVVVIDADMEVDPAQLQTYVHILKEYDICIGSKRHPDSVYRAPLMRKFLSLVFNKIVRLLTGLKYSDSQTGLKAMKGDQFRRLMNVVTVKRFAYDVEILAVAQLMKSRVAELPVTIEQSSGFSKKAVLYMLVDLLGIAYRLRIIKWYQKNLNNHRASYKPIIRW